MSLAGYYANKHFLSHELFHGGPKKECFNIFEDFGYSILPKSETTLIEKARKVALIYPGVKSSCNSGYYYQKGHHGLSKQECAVITVKANKDINVW